MIRVALIGARRVRQGLGPFIARDLRLEGLELAGVLGTTEATATEAASQIGDLSAYTDFDALLDSESPDAVAILSPAFTHRDYLQRALERGLHVLCEKPLCWGEGGIEATSLVNSFAAKGLLLYENCQWPATLSAFADLHGAPETLDTFHMRLSPASRGEQQLGDALPHPLSLLQALTSGPWHVSDLSFTTTDPSAEEQSVRGKFHSEQGIATFQVDLVRGSSLPREAGYSINGRLARRRVQMPEYSMFLGDGSREVPLADPLRAHLSGFAAALRDTTSGKTPPDPSPIAERAVMLAGIVSAYRKAQTPS